MSVKLRGIDPLIKQLEKRFDEIRVQEIVDAALMAGAKVFVRELKIQLKRFQDTGATVNEVTIRKPYTVDGVRQVTIHWKGPKGRYRIIHLNEWGTVRNPNPRGKGKIALALRISEKKYRDTLKEILKREL